ncbi:MAG: TetR/AcrR family transcriptional regulator [Halanaerobiaceae bacterium]
METKDQIVKAAMECFSAQGYDETTVTEIVKKAGVAQGTFYIYFDHKKEVLKEIMFRVREEVGENLEEKISQGDSPAVKIHKAFKSAFLVHQKYRKLAVPLQSGAVALDVQRYYNEIGRKFVTWLEEQIKEGKKQGIFRAEDPRLTAYFIISLYEKVAHSSLILDELDSFDNIFPQLVDFIYRGLDYKKEETGND